jgi:hypothetical protein
MISIRRLVTSNKNIETFIHNINMPACANCVHFIPYKNVTNYFYQELQASRCKKFGQQSLLSGKIEYDLASKCRSIQSMCGKDGKYFIQR